MSSCHFLGTALCVLTDGRQAELDVLMHELEALTRKRPISERKVYDTVLKLKSYHCSSCPWYHHLNPRHVLPRTRCRRRCLQRASLTSRTGRTLGETMCLKSQRCWPTPMMRNEINPIYQPMSILASSPLERSSLPWCLQPLASSREQYLAN